MESVQIGVSSTQLPGLWSWRGKASICQDRPGSLLTSYKLRKYSALETLFLQYVFPSTGSLKRMEAFGSHFFVRQCTKSPNHVFFPNHNFSPTSSPYDYLSLSPLFLSLSFYTHTHTHTNTYFAFHFIIEHSISDNATNFEKIFYLFIFRNTPTIKHKQNSQNNKTNM